MMKYGMTKPELVMMEVEYLKWAGETIVELEQQNAALVEALQAITGGKEQMVDWCINNKAHHGIAGLSYATLRHHIATEALTEVKDG